MGREKATRPYVTSVERLLDRILFADSHSYEPLPDVPLRAVQRATLRALLAPLTSAARAGVRKRLLDGRLVTDTTRSWSRVVNQMWNEVESELRQYDDLEMELYDC